VPVDQNAWLFRESAACCGVDWAGLLIVMNMPYVLIVLNVRMLIKKERMVCR
jgi:hypothetical protein